MLKDSLLFFKDKRLFILAVLSSLVSLLELISVASIFPYLEIITNQSPDKYQLIFESYFEGFVEFNTKNISYTILVIILISILSKGLFQMLELNYVNNKRVNLSRRIFNRLVERGYNAKQDYTNSHLTTLLITEVDIVIQHVLTPIINSFGQVILTIFLLVYLFILDPLILTISVSIFGFYYLIVGVVIRKGLKGNSTRRTSANTKRIRNVEDIINSLALLQLYNAWNYVGSQYIKNYKDYSNTTKINQLSIKIPQTILEGILLSSIVLVVILLDNTNDFQQLIPKLTVFAFAALKLKPSLNGIYGLFISISYGNSALNQIRQFLHLSNSTPEKTSGTIEILPLENQLSIDIQGVSFSYKDNNEIFKDLSFSFKPKGITTITGESGKGKSTLLYLIAGLLNFQEGKISITSSKKKEENLFSMVNQQGFLIEGNLLQNIYLKEKISFEEELKVVKLLKKLGLDDLYHLLKEPLQGLSGGQNQRVNILRAIVHEPEYILMDEPSSSLDEENREKLILLLKEISNTIPIIIVTHDPNVMGISENHIVFQSNSLSFVNHG